MAIFCALKEGFLISKETKLIHRKPRPPSKLVHTVEALPGEVAQREIRRVEQENVGVESAHKGEEIAEILLHTAHRKLQKHRATVRAERTASTTAQKKVIQRRYAAAKRQQAAIAANRAKSAAKKTAEGVKKAALWVYANRKTCLIFLGVAAMVGILFSTFASCAVVMQGAVSGLSTAAYASEDGELRLAEAMYCEMEQALQAEIEQFEETYPDYEDYDYDLDEIGHDPYVLLSMVSAMVEGAWTADEVEDVLEEIFAAQYDLFWTVRGETCTVTLEAIPLEQLTATLLTEEELAAYAGYMAVLGSKPELYPDSPYVDRYITGGYQDCDIPPEALEDEVFANMIEEAEKYLGFPYVWGGSNPSTSFDCSGYVCWVINNCGNEWNIGRTTAQGLYDAATPVSTANAKPGDLIFFTGTYDAGVPVSHVGIYVGNHRFIHCGDPISYASVTEPYWASHLYGYGRIS